MSGDEDVCDLRVVLDASSLHRSAKGNITAGVWFDYGLDCFPERGWSDVVVVVLDWWHAELRALPAVGNPRATVSLDLMDGPFAVRVASPDGEDHPWHARLVRRGVSREQQLAAVRFRPSVLRESITEAQSKVSQLCQANGW